MSMANVNINDQNPVVPTPGVFVEVAAGLDLLKSLQAGTLNVGIQIKYVNLFCLNLRHNPNFSG